jgi:WD40 repeat protein
MSFITWLSIALIGVLHSALASPFTKVDDFRGLGFTTANAQAQSQTGLKQTEAIADPTWRAGTVGAASLDAQKGGHSRSVRSVTFSPDNRFLASSSADRTIKIWDLEAQQVARTLSLGSNVRSQANAIAFSPDGRYLASGSLDGTVKLWDWQTGQVVYSLAGHSNAVKSVAFSPDGQTLASASLDRTIYLWNVETGEVERIIETEQGIEAIALNPVDDTLAAGGVDQKVELWNWRTGDRIRSFPRFSGVIYALSFSPNGERLAFSPNALSPDATYSGDRLDRNTIVFLDLQGRRQGDPLKGHTDYVSAIAFSPSGQTLLSGSWDQTIKVWNAQTGELIRTFSENEQRILSIAYRSDGQAFAVGSGDGTIKLFVSTGE